MRLPIISGDGRHFCLERDVIGLDSDLSAQIHVLHAFESPADNRWRAGFFRHLSQQLQPGILRVCIKTEMTLSRNRRSAVRA